MGKLLRSPRALIIIIGILVLAAAGNLFPAPMPEIALPAETVGTVLGFPITNTLIATWVTMAVLVFVAWRATRNMKLVPSGFQNLVEMSIELLLRLTENAAGKNARRFFPLVATIFIFVLVNNWMGLMPFYGTVGIVKQSEEGYHGKVFAFNEAEVGGLKVAYLPPGREAEAKEGETPQAGQIRGTFVSFLRSANTNLSTTIALSIVAVLLVEYFGITSLGFFKYSSRFVNVKRIFKGQVMYGLIDLFVGGLEAVAEVARIISFSFRLFGNIFAGEVLLAVMTFLIPWVGAVMFYLLEVFVGAIQALIFALLTLVFCSMAVMSHEAHQEAKH
jgi:F-type H+-transporting ATPase subunit a